MAENDYVQMLRESLEKKVEILKEIRVKNAEQGRILTDPNADPDDFSENIEAKGALVDEITKLDDGFEIVFEKVSEELQKNREAYKDEIIRMKELIAWPKPSLPMSVPRSRRCGRARVLSRTTITI